MVMIVITLLLGGSWWYQSKYKIGHKIDSFNTIAVYYNGIFQHAKGRNITNQNYNLGLRYQCVEFVKRYYFEYYHHKMPNSYGHAKDFFNPKLEDGQWNKARNLLQYRNPSASMPNVGDLLIFNRTKWNAFGHVAIISMVNDHEIEIIQQNVGPITRENFKIIIKNGKWKIQQDNILGWLRKKTE